MFHHTVMFSFKDGTTDAQIEAVCDGLATLPTAIPEILRYAFGRDAGVNSGNFDFAVAAEFADRDAYLVYRDHPAHQQIVKDHIAPLIAQRSAVQFERL